MWQTLGDLEEFPSLRDLWLYYKVDREDLIYENRNYTASNSQICKGIRIKDLQSADGNRGKFPGGGGVRG